MFRFARGKEEKKKRLKDENVSRCLHSDRRVSGFVPHSGDERTMRRGRGPKLLWWATKNSGRTPNSFPEGENSGKYWHVHNDIPIFYSFPFQRRRGWKVLRDRTIEKATASNSKPALCVDIVYTYQYIDICRASYLYIPITYIAYGTKVL